MKIGKIEKSGLIIQFISFMAMLFLVSSNKSVPSLIAWCFGTGLVVVVAGALGTLSKNQEKL